MPRNESPENTIMRDVPAGDESGIYYIIISGLPFATIWQLLKDWLRQAGCDVDHIEVFQKSTSGWIRLVGKQNFERALHHLQTVPYNNRLLLYLDKNRTESVKIMELIDDPPPNPKLGGRSRAARSRSRLRAQHKTTLRDQELGRPQATSCPIYAAGPAATSPTFEVPPAMCYRGAPTEPHRALREGYGAQPEPFVRGGWSLQYGPLHAPGYGPLEQAGHPASPRRESDSPSRRHVRFDGVGNRQLKPPCRTGSAASLSDSGQRVQHGSNESFRVQIVSLRQSASAGDVEEWVRHSMGEWASAMSRIDVPSDHEKDCVRGSGYITFLSSAAARRAVELLNQKPFLGRVVCARLVDEGERARSPGEHATCEDAGQAGAPDGPAKDNQGAAASAPSGAGGEADAKHAPPVIAHGTFYRPK